MNAIKDIIQKARKIAGRPEELELSECFEEYIDLLEDRKTLVSPQEQAELMPRLQASFLSLKEAVENICRSYGISFEELMAKAEAIAKGAEGLNVGAMIPRESKVRKG